MLNKFIVIKMIQKLCSNSTVIYRGRLAILSAQQSLKVPGPEEDVKILFREKQEIYIFLPVLKSFLV